jgi:hypothetical protein
VYGVPTTTEATPDGFNRTIGGSGEVEGMEIASTSPVLVALSTIRSSGSSRANRKNQP